MGFTELLTIVFIILKLIGFISWSWWLVLLPEIIAFVLYAVLIIWHIVLGNQIRKEQQKLFDKHWKL